jgi:hypothetical protein
LSDWLQVKLLRKKLLKIGMKIEKEEDVKYVLQTNYSDGDIDKAMVLFELLEDSRASVVKDYDPNVKFLGAVNRQGVTCYLDSILFAMFARLDSFEAMLYKSFDDSERKRLVTLIRLWVNTLRSGRLITVDIVRLLASFVPSRDWLLILQDKTNPARARSLRMG